MILKRAASALLLVAAVLAAAGCRRDSGEAAGLESSPRAGGPRDAAAWWIDTYGLLPAGTPQLDRAEAVFARLAAAADKRGNRLPRLVVLDADGSPYAVAIRDGTVLLTRGALDLCYRDRPAADGDVRLAFVVGHELAHLASDHFWHASAFATVERGGERSGEAVAARRPDLSRLFARSGVEPARSELQADETGLLYLTMAGYDPRRLVDSDDDTSFFAEWVGDAPHDAAFAADPSHPSPEARAEFLRRRLAEVADDVPLFHFGTRLLEMGRHRDAILLLERFGERFAGREVQNNLGVAHFQLALQRLAACDGALLTRYRLPTAVDRQTLAERTIRRGGYSSPCLEDEAFRSRAREASARLEAAVERDPLYVPARLNLVALYLVSDQPARALSQAEDLEKLAPEDPDVRSAAALALYVYGLRSNLDTADRALGQLDAVLAARPDHATALYNRAVLLAERRRGEAAKQAWRAFLAAEPAGPYADVARGWLGMPPAPKKTTPLATDPPSAPVRRGPITAETTAALTGARTREFAIGDLRGATYEWAGWRALRLGETIEIVEARDPS